MSGTVEKVFENQAGIAVGEKSIYTITSAIDVNVVGGGTGPSVVDVDNVLNPVPVDDSTPIDVAVPGGVTVNNASIPVTSASTLDVNVTNASIPVTGTVTVNSITNPVDIDDTTPINVAIPGNVTIDSTTPVDVNVTTASVTVDGTVAVSSITAPVPIDDSTPIDVAVTGQPIGVSGTVAVSSIAAAVPIDDSTPIDVAVTGQPISVSVSGSTATQQVSYADTPNLDAFSRLRVGVPEHVFSSQLLYDLDPTRLEGINSGTGVAPAFNATQKVGDLVVNAGTGTSALQSYTYIPYEPARSQLVFITFVFGAAVANTTVRAGYFDAADGIFLERDGSGDVYFVLRSSTSGAPVETRVLQSAWNVNTLGALDLSLSQILVIDLQYLGMGRVRCGFDIDGVLVPCHQFLNANNLALPYMCRASLPIRVSCDAAVSAAAATVKYKCAAVSSEGGTTDFETRSFATPNIQITTSGGTGTRNLIATIRPKTTGVGGVTSRTQFKLKTLNFINTSNDTLLWELTAGGTNTPGAFTDVNTTYSNFEYAPGGTHTNLTGGVLLESGYISGQGGSRVPTEAKPSFTHPCSLNAAGANTAFTTYYLLVTPLTGNATVNCCIEFSES